MADWTLIITTLGATGISGGIGFLGARMTTAMQSRQIEAENQRLREQIEAERERLRDEHREVHLRSRKDAYVDFLEVERHLRGRAISGVIDNDDFERFHRLGMAVEVFGARAARDLVRQLVGVWAQAFVAWVEGVGNGEDAEAAGQAAVRAHDAELNRIRAELYEAMRADVAADI